MILSCMIHVHQHLIVKSHGAHLIVGSGQQLDHVMPMAQLLGLAEGLTLLLKESDDPKAKEVVEKFEEGFDMVSEENLGDILEFLGK